MYILFVYVEKIIYICDKILKKEKYNIYTLTNDILENMRKKVTCMHLDDDELIKLVKEAGFTISKLWKKLEKLFSSAFLLS